MAREGFQRLSLLSGETTAEYYTTGQQVLRSRATGRFISRASTGLDLSNIKAMFDNWINQAKAIATAETAGVKDTVYIMGIRQVMYRVNFIEALYRIFPSLEPLVRTEVTKAFVLLLSNFVETEVRPRAMQLIDEEVYAGSLGKTGANISKRGEFTPEHADMLGRRAEDIEFQTGARTFGRLSTLRSKGMGRSKKTGITKGTIPTGVVGAFDPSKYIQEQPRVHLTFPSALRVSEMKSRSGFMFSRYAGATGILRQALYAGIHATPTSIIIGVDESMFPERPLDPKGKIYWQFVEYGHKYVWKHPKTGKLTVMPFTEPEKPFLRKLHEWMRTEGSAKLEQEVWNLIAATHQLLTNALKQQMGVALGKAGLGIQEFTGSKIGTFNPLTGTGTGIWGRQVKRGMEGMKGQYAGRLT